MVPKRARSSSSPTPRDRTRTSAAVCSTRDPSPRRSPTARVGRLSPQPTSPQQPYCLVTGAKHAISPVSQLRSSTTSINLFFFFNDTATPEIYPPSLHDALPFFFKEPAPHRHSLSNLPRRLPL